MNNNLQGIENSWIFKNLGAFNEMVMRKYRRDNGIGVQNPDDPSDERTGFDEGESEKVNNQEN